MTVPAKTPPTGDVMESVIIKGDIGKLTPDERVRYYNEVCRSIGLNPLTQPLKYMVLSGKQILYAGRDAADQLRKINGISIEVVSQDLVDGLLTVHVRAKDRDGRQDEDLGVVPLPETMRGEQRANQILKCVTKAKRRVTLSISGLGFLDETEVEDIPGVVKAPQAAPNVMKPRVFTAKDVEDVAKQGLPGPVYDPLTGEIVESVEEKAPLQGVPSSTLAGAAPSVTTTGAALSIQDMAREAASRGRRVFNEFWRLRSPREQDEITQISEELRQVLEAPAQKEEEDFK